MLYLFYFVIKEIKVHDVIYTVLSAHICNDLGSYGVELASERDFGRHGVLNGGLPCLFVFHKFIVVIYELLYVT